MIVFRCTECERIVYYNETIDVDCDFDDDVIYICPHCMGILEQTTDY